MNNPESLGFPEEPAFHLGGPRSRLAAGTPG